MNDCGFHGQDLMVDICYIYLGTVFRDSKHITIYIYIYIYLFLHLGFHLENVWGNTEWLIDGFVYTI